MHEHLDIWTVHTWLDTQAVPSSSPSPCTTPQNCPFLPQRPLRNQQGHTLSLCPSNPPVRLSKPHLCPGSVHQSHFSLPSLGEGGGVQGPTLTPAVGLGGRCGVSLAWLPTPSSILRHQQPLFVLVLPQNRLCSAPALSLRVQGEGLPSFWKPPPKFCPKPPFLPHLLDFSPFTAALIRLPTCT